MQLQEGSFHTTAQWHAKYAKVWHRFIKEFAGPRDNGGLLVDPQMRFKSGYRFRQNNTRAYKAVGSTP